MATRFADSEAVEQTGINPLEQLGGEGPTVDGFRDSQVAESLAADIDVSEDAPDSEKSLTTRVFDQMVSFQRLVVGGVTLAVGVLVYNEVVGALPNSNGAINQTPINGTVESAFALAPVALIVIIAAVILAQVGGFMGGGRN